MSDKFVLDTDYRYFIPRKTRLSLTPRLPLGYVLFVTCVAIITILFSIFAANRAYSNHAFEQRFVDEGVKTQATVTACQYRYTGKGSVTDLTFTYGVNEIEYESTKSERGDCGDYYAGMIFDAIYLSSDPKQIRLIFPQSPFENGVVLIINFIFDVMAIGVLLIMFLGGIFIGLFSLFDYGFCTWRIHMLRHYGDLVQGTITGIEEEQLSSGKQITVLYQFSNPANKTISGKQIVDFYKLPNNRIPIIGTEVTVLYANDFAHMVL